MLHKDRSPLVSIIIPCYNYGAHIDETLASIDRIADKNIYEVIIVNDGSTDAFTNERLEAIAKTGLYHVIFQENKGVCAAKNTAIAQARGKYILPVDADDRLCPEFIDEGLAVFNANDNVSIIYPDYYLFGEVTGIRKAGEFNLQKLMLENYIVNCAMYKKSMVSEIGGYDLFFSRIGAEDWDFWLNAAFHGYVFHYLEKPLFEYRITNSSRTTRLLANRHIGNVYIDYFNEKYDAYYGLQHVDMYFLKKFRKNFFAYIFKIGLMLYFPRYFNSLVKKQKLRKYI